MPASSVPLGPGRVQAALRPGEDAQRLPGAVWGWPPPRPVRWVPGAWDHSSEVSPAALCACVVRGSSEDGVFRSLSCEGFICPKLGLPEPPGRPPCWWPVSAHGARASSWSGGSVDLQASQPWGRFPLPLGEPAATRNPAELPEVGSWGEGTQRPASVGSRGSCRAGTLTALPAGVSGVWGGSRANLRPLRAVALQSTCHVVGAAFGLGVSGDREAGGRVLRSSGRQVNWSQVGHQ